MNSPKNHDANDDCIVIEESFECDDREEFIQLPKALLSPLQTPVVFIPSSQASQAQTCPAQNQKVEPAPSPPLVAPQPPSFYKPNNIIAQDRVSNGLASQPGGLLQPLPPKFFAQISTPKTVPEVVIVDSDESMFEAALSGTPVVQNYVEEIDLNEYVEVDSPSSETTTPYKLENRTISSNSSSSLMPVVIDVTDEEPISPPVTNGAVLEDDQMEIEEDVFVLPLPAVPKLTPTAPVTGISKVSTAPTPVATQSASNSTNGSSNPNIISLNEWRRSHRERNGSAVPPPEPEPRNPVEQCAFELILSNIYIAASISFGKVREAYDEINAKLAELIEIHGQMPDDDIDDIMEISENDPAEHANVDILSKAIDDFVSSARVSATSNAALPDVNSSNDWEENEQTYKEEEERLRDRDGYRHQKQENRALWVAQLPLSRTYDYVDNILCGFKGYEIKVLKRSPARMFAAAVVIFDSKRDCEKAREVFLGHRDNLIVCDAIKKGQKAAMMSKKRKR